MAYILLNLLRKLFGSLNVVPPLFLIHIADIFKVLLDPFALHPPFFLVGFGLNDLLCVPVVSSNLCLLASHTNFVALVVLSHTGTFELDRVVIIADLSLQLAAVVASRKLRRRQLHALVLQGGVAQAQQQLADVFS